MKQLELFEAELLDGPHPVDRAGHYWTAIEEEMLALAVASHKTPLEIARMLGRAETAVAARMKLLGLTELERKLKEAKARATFGFSDEPIFEEV